MNVPFVDLYAQYLSIREEIDQAIARVIRESAFIGGRVVASFEEAFAGYAGLPHCVSCANGTDSLEMILRAAGIGPGDEVIVPAVSWISTSEAVSAVGAVPVFSDVDDRMLMDVRHAASLVTARTRAIIPVHLYGNPADMHSVMELAARHALFVLEDCAQSHGAAIGGRPVGTFGHAASYSFYPGKNLGAYGDAGAVLTSDPILADRVRAMANHGQLKKHEHRVEGRNSRLDGMQAAILSAKLPHLESWTSARIRHAELYGQLLPESITRIARPNRDCRHVYHLYVVELRNRDVAMQKLAERGISTAIHYPRPLPLLPCYVHRNFRAEDFPGASRTSGILSLPMFAELSGEQIRYVASQLREVSVLSEA